ncbi:MAG: DNA primase [Prevotella sp.]|nr:DNA primase [Prevotella sp.]
MIDKATQDKIKDAANIVEVVSEFVTLHKSGANYKGLCPFHNEKTPSFIVSPARGTCHCFGCGKGGTPVSFIMEHEQLTYPEALRWLANKYHIEIRERELTDNERREQNERESMFIVNEWATSYFNNILHDNPDGVALGLQYFRSRGFRDDIIKKFRLGYDIADRHALAAAARAAGYNEEFLLRTGICYRNDRGELIDRYAGRVMFPWTGISGKIVGFGGRLLDSRTKGVNQKYVNSPDSDIYHKDRELYGIYQAKKAIAREDRVYMVEGYTDVISMHQCGIENVVANSGTALSVHQIHTLHRFTSNITLLYDGDAAGIHAAMRGTDMLLAEGMNLKVLLLPDGDDPDSFARKHTAADFRKYIEEHQTDFMEFKTDLMLKNERDPLKRSEAINSIIKSISLVNDQILRDTYLHDCAMRMGMNEATLINTMNKFIRDGRSSATAQGQQPQHIAQQQRIATTATPLEQASKVEQMIIKMVIKHGSDILYRNVEDEDGNLIDLTLAQFLDYNLSADSLTFSNDIFTRILQEAVEHSTEEGFDSEQYFIHHDDIEVSRLATTLSEERYRLSAPTADDENLSDIERQQQEETRIERLRLQLDHLLNDFRMDMTEHKLKDLQRQIATPGTPTDEIMRLMAEYKDTQMLRNQLAKKLGNNIIV